VENAINSFVFETLLISPIEDIIKKLETREFRDCDIVWLNDKLASYTKLACETLGENIALPDLINMQLNDYGYNKYLNYFRILLNYFENLT
jgi:hypothetical protein